jgi:glycopeptide antibiotics resistance protein
MHIKQSLDNSKNKAYMYFVPAGLWALLIMFVCLVSPKYIPVVKFDLFSPDKIAHALLFGILCLFLIWGLNKNNFLTHKNMLLLTLSTIGYGAIIEFLQMISRNGRQADIDDIIANSFGALLIYLFYSIYYRSIIRKTAEEH